MGPYNLDHPIARTEIAPLSPGGGTGLLDGFVRSARRYAQREALRLGQRSYSYADLDHTARLWAARLLEAAGARPRRVGILAYRNELSYIGPLCALFCGACFVPLNPRHPLERILEMVAAANLDAVMADETAAPILQALKARDAALCVFAPAEPPSPGGAPAAREIPTGCKPVESAPRVAADAPAYILFTSGSTGRPKGIPISHGSVRAFLDENHGRYDFGPHDRFSQTFDQTFDLSLFDLFMAWESGACVHAMTPMDLLTPHRFVNQHQITVWFSVPAVGMLQLRRGRLAESTMPSLRWSLFCGEALPAKLAEAWARAAPNATLENLYGPTEFTIACTAYRWDPIRSPAACVNGLVPIGSPYAGIDAVLRAEDGTIATDEGELCLAGTQCFSGYLDNTPDAANPFMPMRRPDGSSRRYYRTGDLVRRVGDEYVFLRRLDDQIKLLGHRVELNEIEHRLREAGCDDAVAVACPSPVSAEYLVAFVTGDIDVSRLMAELRRRLPEILMPREIEKLDRLPLNVNGKIDRAALARRAGRSGSEMKSAAQ